MKKLTKLSTFDEIGRVIIEDVELEDSLSNVGGASRNFGSCTNSTKCETAQNFDVCTNAKCN